jgi:ribonuclease BN (tRNA processing enzyme)
MTSIQFLGTGGGRFVLLSQKRYTGGIWLESRGKHFVIDPGPGALIRCLEYGLEPRKLHAILVSHNHLDHYNDAEILLEGMTASMNKRRGVLAANKSVLPYISEYHKSFVDVIEFDSETEFELEGIRVETIPTFDHDNGFGFKFHTKDGIITYGSDTNYNTALSEYYHDSDIIILNVLRPAGDKIRKHLDSAEAEQLITEAQPKKAVLSHFGMKMLAAGPERIAAEISKNTGIETIAARDGQVFELGQKAEDQKNLFDY